MRQVPDGGSHFDPDSPAAERPLGVAGDTDFRSSGHASFSSDLGAKMSGSSFRTLLTLVPRARQGGGKWGYTRKRASRRSGALYGAYGAPRPEACAGPAPVFPAVRSPKRSGARVCGVSMNLIPLVRCTYGFANKPMRRGIPGPLQGKRCGDLQSELSQRRKIYPCSRHRRSR